MPPASRSRGSPATTPASARAGIARGARRRQRLVDLRRGAPRHGHRRRREGRRRHPHRPRHRARAPRTPSSRPRRTAAASSCCAAPATPASPRTSRSSSARAPSLTVVSLQEWNDDAVHLASHFARLGRDAFLKHIVVSLGGKVVRVNPSTHLAEQGADVEALGLYFADAGQHLEQQVYVHHDAPHTRSRVTYKGALQGAGARTVWIGDVLIGNAATGTDSYEQNRNLVLTEGTRADSVPEPRDRDRRHRGRRPRQRDRPLRRRAAVLPAGPRHQRGRGASPRRARLPHRDRAEDRLARARGAAASPRSRPSWKDADVASVRVCDVDELGVNEAVPLRRRRRGHRRREGRRRRRLRHRRHLHARRHLARRGLRRGRHPRVLGARLQVLAPHRQAAHPSRPTSRSRSSRSR